MKAIVYEKYGSADVLEFKEIEKPKPKDNEVLIKVHATSLNYSDWHMMKGEPYIVRLWSGLQKPKDKVLGADIAGTIEQVGKDVSVFKIGDEVFGNVSECGWGGLAEFLTATEEALVLKPQNVSFEDAASVPQAAFVGVQALRDKGNIKSGHRVLINGASGGVGTFAVQIAKSFGADVTGVCSTSNLEMVKFIGADRVIDYKKESFLNSGEKYDLIIGANGNQSILKYRKALEPSGTYIATGGSMKQIFQAMLLGPLISMFGNRKLTNLYSTPSKELLLYLSNLLEEGKLKPVIDKTYPLSKTADAFRYCEKGHAKGKVVIRITE